MGARRLRRQPVAQTREVLGKVDLVQDQQVGDTELARHRIADATVGAALADLGGIDHDDHAVAGKPRLQHGEIGDAAGIGHARRLDHDMIEAFRSFQQGQERGHQRIADRAAEAAVGERDRVAGVVGHEPPVDVEGAEVVHQHREAPSGGAAQQAVQQRGLAGSQEAADHGEGNRIAGHTNDRPQHCSVLSSNECTKASPIPRQGPLRPRHRGGRGRGPALARGGRGG